MFALMAIQCSTARKKTAFFLLYLRFDLQTNCGLHRSPRIKTRSGSDPWTRSSQSRPSRSHCCCPMSVEVSVGPPGPQLLVAARHTLHPTSTACGAWRLLQVVGLLLQSQRLTRKYASLEGHIQILYPCLYTVYGSTFIYCNRLRLPWCTERFSFSHSFFTDHVFIHSI